jgi:UDP-4-amino-4,6-dideoxy-N-acetyl-beta-L-altrosamine transaminase
VSTIPYGRQEITDEDVAAVAHALRAPFLTQGPRVREFEGRLAEVTGARHAVAFNSGTAALHAAYFAAGIRPGRTVLTSPITFAATANAALYLGGGVRFAEVDPDTILLDPAAVAEVTAPEVAVLAPVHFGGQVSEMEQLGRLAGERGWVVVEDAAHALGASYTTAGGARHRVGECAHSTMCCFSFHPVKQVTTGEGGAVTTNDERCYRELLRFRSHGITRDPAELSRSEGPWYYEQLDLGFNYRLTDFQCVLGMSQLARLTGFIERRRVIAARYDQAFAAMAGVRALPVPRWSTGAYHLYVIRVPAARRRAVFDGLRSAGIGVNVHYIPVYHHPYYRRHGFGEAHLPLAEAYYAEAITLPMFPGLTDDQVDYVIASVRGQLSA